MIVLQWIVWCFALLLFFGFLLSVRQDAKNGKPVHIITIVETTLLLVFPLVFLFCPWSKFHLLWVAPCCFIVSKMGFFVFRVPIIGAFLRVVFLFLGRVFLIGIGGTIQGVPYGK